MTRSQSSNPSGVFGKKKRLFILLGIMTLLALAVIVVHSNGQGESAWSKTNPIPAGGAGLPDQQLLFLAACNIIIRHQGDLTKLSTEELNLVGFIGLLSEQVTPQAVTRIALGGEAAATNIARLSQSLEAFGAVACKDVLTEQLIPMSASMSDRMVLPPSASKIDEAFAQAWIAEDVAGKVAQVIRNNPKLCE